MIRALTNITFAIRIALSSITLFAAQAPLYDKSTRLIADRGIAIDPADFRQDHLKVISAKFLSEVKNKELARLLIVDDESEIGGLLYHGTPTNTYASEIASVRAYACTHRRVAQVLKTGKSAILAIRNGETYTQLILSGTANAASNFDESAPLKLLHFRLILPARADERRRTLLDLYFEAKRHLSARRVFEMTKDLRKKLDVSSITVKVRRDVWFIEDQHFPAVYPFGLSITVPTYLEYETGYFLQCSDGPGYSECSGKHITP